MGENVQPVRSMESGLLINDDDDDDVDLCININCNTPSSDAFHPPNGLTMPANLFEA